MTPSRRNFGMALGSLALVPLAACAATTAMAATDAPPAAPYQPVSKLVPLPNFIPGLGTLYVDPKTLPYGPFLAYDHQGRQVSTIYMVPLKDIDAHKKIEDLKAPGGAVTSVDMYFNAGHPGVPEPHYHIVLWHVADGEESVAK